MQKKCPANEWTIPAVSRNTSVCISIWRTKSTQKYDVERSELECRIPDPQFPIIIKNVDRCKHGSDSETYDTEGNYVPQKFEEVFSKYAKTRKDGLNAK